MAENDLNKVIENLKPDENMFHQAVAEVAHSISGIYQDEPTYKQGRVFERLFNHDRTIKFRVTWQDDEGTIHHNTGWRVQHNNSLGAYKGGLRFHPSVEEETFKFLSYEQTFKNALTGLPMGGAKGGSDFDPKGKSDNEIMRFCQAFMIELKGYIGRETDVPAGDIGVSSREIGYLFGAYKSLTDQHQGVLTGKDPSYGGSYMRAEATGYGAAYFLCHVLESEKQTIAEKKIAISGAGNVAIYQAEKLVEMGGIVVSLSDSKGTLLKKDGFTKEDIKSLKILKFDDKKRLSDYSDYKLKADYHEGKSPWGLCNYDIASPSATQNEVDENDLKAIKKAGATIISEAANMPLTQKAGERALSENIIILPGKAVNAGGVAVSGVERTQNAIMEQWSPERVDKELKSIMREIFEKCRLHMPDHKSPDRYIHGANIAGFRKVATAILAQGIIN